MNGPAAAPGAPPIASLSAALSRWVLNPNWSSGGGWTNAWGAVSGHGQAVVAVPGAGSVGARTATEAGAA